MIPLMAKQRLMNWNGIQIVAVGLPLTTLYILKATLMILYISLPIRMFSVTALRPLLPQPPMLRPLLRHPSQMSQLYHRPQTTAHLLESARETRSRFHIRRAQTRALPTRFMLTVIMTAIMTPSLMRALFQSLPAHPTPKRD